MWLLLWLVVAILILSSRLLGMRIRNVVLKVFGQVEVADEASLLGPDLLSTNPSCMRECSAEETGD